MKKYLRIATPLLLALTACAPGTPSAFKGSTPSAIPSYSKFTIENPVAVPSDACNDNCQGFRHEFQYVVYVGKQIYCYWDLKRAETQTDFDTLATQLEAKITNDTSPSQYLLILKEWASAFHDGHVNALPKADLSEIEQYSSPVRLDIVGAGTDHEQIFVSQLTESVDGIKVGDVVTQLNGKPVNDAVDAAEKMTSGSTRRMRRFFGAKKLLDVIGLESGSEPIDLTLLRNGAEVHASAPRTIKLNPKPEALVSLPGASATGADSMKVSILPGGIGYLRIDGFGGSQDTFLFDQAMNDLSKTKGLLIDVRRNGGGDQSGTTILSRFAKAATPRYKVSARISDFLLAMEPDLFLSNYDPKAAFMPTEDMTITPSSDANHYAGPVVVVTSPNCFSACDTFTSGLKVNGFATVVGEGTGGGTGSPLVFALPKSGHSFRYGVVRGFTAKGDYIEGNGTLPDVVIEQTLAERTQGVDKQLIESIKVLQSKITGSPALSTQLTQAAQAMSTPFKQNADLTPALEEDYMHMNWSSKEGVRP